MNTLLELRTFKVPKPSEASQSGKTEKDAYARNIPQSYMYTHVYAPETRLACALTAWTD